MTVIRSIVAGLVVLFLYQSRSLFADICATNSSQFIYSVTEASGCNWPCHFTHVNIGAGVEFQGTWVNVCCCPDWITNSVLTSGPLGTNWGFVVQSNAVPGSMSDYNPNVTDVCRVASMNVGYDSNAVAQMRGLLQEQTVLGNEIAFRNESNQVSHLRDYFPDYGATNMGSASEGWGRAVFAIATNRSGGRTPWGMSTPSNATMNSEGQVTNVPGVLVDGSSTLSGEVGTNMTSWTPRIPLIVSASLHWTNYDYLTGVTTITNILEESYWADEPGNYPGTATAIMAEFAWYKAAFRAAVLFMCDMAFALFSVARTKSLMKQGAETFNPLTAGDISIKGWKFKLGSVLVVGVVVTLAMTNMAVALNNAHGVNLDDWLQKDFFGWTPNSDGTGYSLGSSPWSPVVTILVWTDGFFPLVAMWETFISCVTFWFASWAIYMSFLGFLKLKAV